MPADSLSVTFAALADPTRRAILARLASGACSVTELAEPFEMSMPAVSKHLRVLERAGLVARGRAAQWRPCQLDAAPLKEVADWAERYRHVWEGRLNRLDDYLQQLQTSKPPACRARPQDQPRRRRMRATPSAAHSGTFQVTTPSDTEITLTRLFNAPRDLVWEAMTKPEHVRRWWGCLDERYSVPVCEIDLRVGGKWRFVGRGPEGDIPAFYGEYLEIDRPGRLVYTEIFEPFPDGGSLVTQRLDEEQGKTRLTVTARYDSRETRDMVIGTGMEKGAAISYDRLEDLVQTLQR